MIQALACVHVELQSVVASAATSSRFASCGRTQRFSVGKGNGSPRPRDALRDPSIGPQVQYCGVATATRGPSDVVNLWARRRRARGPPNLDAAAARALHRNRSQGG